MRVGYKPSNQSLVDFACVPVNITNTKRPNISVLSLIPF